MNTLRNRVNLLGNIGQDPELRTFENGKKVAYATLAVLDEYKDSEGSKILETIWHNIVFWNSLAELAMKCLKKGNQIAIEGKITYRSYENKKLETHYVTEIVVTDFLLINPIKK